MILLALAEQERQRHREGGISAAAMDHQTPSTPKRSGRISTASIWKTSVRRNGHRRRDRAAVQGGEEGGAEDGEAGEEEGAGVE